MHDTSTYYYQGWQSGPYTIESGAYHACWNHEKAQEN